MFPVDAQKTLLTLNSIALDISTVVPLSLNDPVGLSPSSLKKTFKPRIFEKYLDLMSGVPPSFIVIIFLSEVIGNISLYLQWLNFLLLNFSHETFLLILL